VLPRIRSNSRLFPIASSFNRVQKLCFRGREQVLPPFGFGIPVLLECLLATVGLAPARRNRFGALDSTVSRPNLLRSSGTRPLNAGAFLGLGGVSTPNLLRSLGSRPCFALLTRALPACSLQRRSGLSRHVAIGLVRYPPR
jgi:hypothetical protein